MIKDPSNDPKTNDIRELSLDEIDATAGAGWFSNLIHAIGALFGAGDPKPPRSPFNQPPDYLR